MKYLKANCSRLVTPGKAGILLLSGILLLITLTTIVQAQVGGGYDLSWFTVAGGGGNSQGGTYWVTDTLGQPDAHDWSSGGQFSVQGGFWGGISETYPIFLPVILK
jgi:hypothetical protein